MSAFVNTYALTSPRPAAIEDPNTDLVLWESGAIINYLIDQYDTNHTISYATLKEKHQSNQWRKCTFIWLLAVSFPIRKGGGKSILTKPQFGPVHFQMSGQGPYFGQAGWFNVLHAEKLPSAISRYQDEVRRIHGVLEGWLAKREQHGSQWLVGDKMTYADLAFTTWNDRSDAILECAPEDKFKGFPRVQDWHERMTSRPSWKKAMELRAKLMDEQGLTWTGMPKGFKNLAEYQQVLKANDETATDASK